MAGPASAVAYKTPDEDVLSAQCYELLARLLSVPPDDALLAELAGLGSADDTPLGRAFAALGEAARATSPKAVTREYNALFIGIARGELVPYASYYLTGFLNEKPLATLRQDMARLGIARVEGIKEPEDHIGALCDMMAGLIRGAFGAAADLSEQRQFFTAHIERWAPRFFADLEAAKAAAFYRPVGTIGGLLLAIEAKALAMDGP